jgi:hypothetical protein
MLEIIRERHRAERVEHCLAFTDNDGCGYNFDCDENGNVIFNPEFEECQRQNYEAAMAAGPEAFPLEFNHHTVRRFRYTENAIGRCRCGEEFELYDQYQGACPCPKCGQWYNMFGQELVDPEHWVDDGEEDY